MDPIWLKRGQIWNNQSWRDAVVLVELPDACGNPEYLVEYSMPRGTSALRIYHADNTFTRVAYERLPKKWLRTLAADDIRWEGYPQQRGSKGRIPSPRELLSQRGG